MPLPRRPHPAPVRTLRRAPSPQQAAARALAAQIDAVLAERDGVLEGEQDRPVHRMRVASRRLREAIRIAGSFLGEEAAGALAREGRRITKALGDLREAQVSLGLLRSLAGEADPDEAAGLDFLVFRQERRIRRLRRRARARIGRASLPRFARHLRAAARALSAIPDAPPLRDLLDPPALRAEAAREALGEVPADQRLHELRIETKHLRYAVEILAGHRARGARLAESLRALQDALGSHHDWCVLAAEATAVAERLERRGLGRLAHMVARAAGAAGRSATVARGRALAVLRRWPPGSFLRRSRSLAGAAGPAAAADVAASPAIAPAASSRALKPRAAGRGRR